MPIHAQGQGFDAKQGQERVHRRLGRAQIAQPDRVAIGRVAQFAEGLGENQAVIFGRRFAEAGKLVVLHPVEAPGINDHAAQGRTVARQELGGRMDDQVGAMFERPAQIGRRQGIIDNQRDAGFMRDRRDGRRKALGQGASTTAMSLPLDHINAMLDRASPPAFHAGRVPARVMTATRWP